MKENDAEHIWSRIELLDYFNNSKKSQPKNVRKKLSTYKIWKVPIFKLSKYIIVQCSYFLRWP